MNQKGFVPILIVVLITLLAVGGYFIYTNYLSNQTKPVEYVQTTQDPTPSKSTTPTVLPVDETKKSVDVFYIEDQASLITNGEIQFENIGKTFFSNHEDKYDFIHIFIANYPSIETNNIHIHVRNYPAKGLGYVDDDQFDPTKFGAKNNGRLMGFTHIGVNLEVDQIQDSEEVYRILLEEIGHNWGVYLGKAIEDTSNDSNLTLREQGPHWNKGLQSLKDYDGIREAKPWVDNGDGTFSLACWNSDKKYSYSPFTLYLMGLADPEEIKKPFLLIDSPELKSSDNIQNFCTPFSDKITIHGTSTKITIDDIIRIAGKKRTVTSKDAQKDFTMAFIVIYPKGTIPTDQAKKNIDFFSKQFPSKWAKATSCRSNMEAVQLSSDECKSTIFPKRN